MSKADRKNSDDTEDLVIGMKINNENIHQLFGKFAMDLDKNTPIPTSDIIHSLAIGLVLMIASRVKDGKEQVVFDSVMAATRESFEAVLKQRVAFEAEMDKDPDNAAKVEAFAHFFAEDPRSTTPPERMN